MFEPNLCHMSLSLSLTSIVIVQIMQILAANRLSEVHDAQEENRVLSEQLQNLHSFSQFSFLLQTLPMWLL